MLKYKIQKHENISTKRWYGTNLDSQIFFKETWYKIPKNILNKYFEIGDNGGSYSLNFSSDNLKKIKQVLKIKEEEVVYLQEITHSDGNVITNEVSYEDYINYKPTLKEEPFTDYLSPYFSSM